MESQTHTFFAELITQLALIRENNGFTIEEAARRMGVDKAAVSRLERGLTNPTVRTLTRYADAINASVALLAMPNTTDPESLMDAKARNWRLMRQNTARLEKVEEIPNLVWEIKN
ncbi:MAG: helix-turn-helix transcriptional regulator [Corynebacterium sp.]|nr:helix-turn-helix transcriptional regulator [Corynebacterium sp.]